MATSNYSLALCQSDMSKTFPGLPVADYADLHDLLCSENATDMIDKIQTDFQIHELRDSVRTHYSVSQEHVIGCLHIYMIMYKDSYNNRFNGIM